MTENDKITTVQALVSSDEEATDALVAVYLSDAESAILGRLYRVYGDIPADATLPRYCESIQCRLAARMFLRRGGEGELRHSENGVAREYGSVSDEDLLKEVIPFAKVGG